MRKYARYFPNWLEAAWLFLGLGTMMYQDKNAQQALSGVLYTTDILRFGCVMIALTIVVLHLKRVPRFRVNPITIFLIYNILGVASSLWSTSFVNSLGKSVELLTATAVVWVTMARPDKNARLQRLVNWSIVETALCLVYVIIGAILDPENYIEASPGIFHYDLGGERFSSNSVSRYGALLGLFCLAKALTEQGRRRWFYGLGYLICLAFPVAAQGRTGMIAVVLGTALIFARLYPMRSILAIPATAGFALLMFGDILLKLFMRGEDQAQFDSLSGRTTMWDAAWQVFLARPLYGVLFGTGFGVGGRTVFLKLSSNALTPAFFNGISSLHNGLMEVLLGVGLFGFIVWLFAVLWATVPAIVAYIRGDQWPNLIGLVAVFTATFLSTGIGGWLDQEVQYFLAASAILWLRGRQRETAQIYPARTGIGAMPVRQWSR
jgi:O-antigen ligase